MTDIVKAVVLIVLILALAWVAFSGTHKHESTYESSTSQAVTSISNAATEQGDGPDGRSYALQVVPKWQS